MTGPFEATSATRPETRWPLPLLLFFLCLSIFLLSPVRQAGDSFYALLLSHNLLAGDGFRLDRYFEPPLDPERYPGLPTDSVMEDDLPYQIYQRRGHYYYVFPPGTSLLSAPLLPPARWLGLSPVASDGSYDSRGDRRLGKRITAVLCALFAVIVYRLARLELPTAWSAALAMTFALASQVWSTSSRALWSHSWLLVLSALVVRHLLAWEAGEGKLRPVWVASLLAWGTITRPTALVPLVAVGLYLLVRGRRALPAYGTTALGWLALFALYARLSFGSWLLPYYSPRRAGLSTFWEALAGNLVSPARGSLIFMPYLLFLAYLLLRYRRELRYPALVGLALTIVAGHWLLISSIGQWWGGYAYGPRLMTDVAPWLALLSVLALGAWLHAGSRLGNATARHSVERFVLASLVLAAVVINAGGALSKSANLWNEVPTPIDQAPSRLWDWGDPQWLAWAYPRKGPAP